MSAASVSCAPLHRSFDRRDGRVHDLPVPVKRVVVVDDDVLMADLIARALVGFDVVIAHDGLEALALAAPGNRVDLVIADYLMPSMTGDEVIARLRAHRPHLKTLVITGHCETLDHERPAWWATQPRLPKPFSIPSLLAAVDGLIGSPLFRRTTFFV